MDKTTGNVIDLDHLTARFPTHRHDARFWESLGRAVATFGFLEEILGKGDLRVYPTRLYSEQEIQAAYAQWIPELERALIDPLGLLIDVYGKAVKEHGSETFGGLENLLEDLRKAAAMRNILCHGSWQPPDAQGAAVPFFVKRVNRQLEVVETAMDCRYIDQIQQHTAELACVVINTVTAMGYQFPGISGPGKPIWKKK